jgi:hypothetical protein
VGEGSIPAGYPGLLERHDSRRLAVILLRKVCVDTAGVVTLALLVVLPDEDGGPGQHTGYQPPGGAKDQKKEKDPGKKCQYTRLQHQ